MFLHDAGAVNLVVAVIQQAVTDYRYAQKMARTDVNRRRDAIHKNCTRDPKAALDPWEQLNQLEMFFKGRWFHTLVDIDGERVVELLNTTREGKRVTRFHGTHDERLRAIPRQKGEARPAHRLGEDRPVAGRQGSAGGRKLFPPTGRPGHGTERFIVGSETDERRNRENEKAVYGRIGQVGKCVIFGKSAAFPMCRPTQFNKN